MKDKLLYIGRILVRELPQDWSEEQFKREWARKSERQRDKYTVYEAKNLITTNGRSQILTYIGSTAGAGAGIAGFAQYFAVGTFPVIQVTPNDTTVNTELTRLVPTTTTISGNTIDISTFFSASTGNGNWTNCGIFGVNATGTSGSGTLMTHALFSYAKTSAQAVTADYLITIN